MGPLHWAHRVLPLDCQGAPLSAFYLGVFRPFTSNVITVCSGLVWSSFLFCLCWLVFVPAVLYHLCPVRAFLSLLRPLFPVSLPGSHFPVSLPRPHFPVSLTSSELLACFL